MSLDSIISALGTEPEPDTASKELALDGREDLSRHSAFAHKLRHEYIDEIKRIGKIKEEFANGILKFLWAFSSFCAIVVVMQAYPQLGFHLDKSIILTLVGGTFASAISLVAIVLRGLFKVEKEPPPLSKEDEKK
ncbi:hypothetical protein [Komagataeibacter sp. FXV3]|uniref:hypothetical protein n=1 Tax=Komagataeibacter sp. FXV3 TaxID=2608998 RepID=UPI00187B328E|nr:hypothetical protein [Komagataeibacter sp. FXV3]MBE7729427.1 hypothetical protein [Komagataeibacter sp. FXV3]